MVFGDLHMTDFAEFRERRKARAMFTLFPYGSLLVAIDEDADELAAYFNVPPQWHDSVRIFALDRTVDLLDLCNALGHSIQEVTK